MSKRTIKPLTAAEARVVKDFEAGELRPVSPRRTALQRYQQAARATLKDRRLNIRLTAPVLEELQARAAEEGLPYQTLISSVLHKFVTGRLVEKSRKASR